MRNEPLRFYPSHPSDRKTHQIETTAMPFLTQDTPFAVKALCDEFAADADSFLTKYADKRFEVTGIAKKIGPDIHNKPSIEISDRRDGRTYALVIFPSSDPLRRVAVGDTVIVRANYLVMSNHYGTVMKFSELISVAKQEKIRLNYPLFDGEHVKEHASVVVENGVITAVEESEYPETNCFLIPGLIDAHTHMGTKGQINAMLGSGVTATCDVAAPASLIADSGPFTIVSSAGMTMGTLHGKSYVQRAIEDGAAYIKVLLTEPNLMPKPVLKDICQTAHKHGIKVAVHAVSVKAVQMSVDCNADILLHVPMKEVFPEELAKTIAEKRIAVAPTLIMMEAFANSNRNKYKPEHYQNAENAVRLLHEYGVTILAATDANNGSFAPAVAYGTSLHREMELLARAGMTPTEILSSATANVAKAFGIGDFGRIAEGQRANLLLVEGRPNKEIADTRKIKQIWIDGQTIL